MVVISSSCASMGISYHFIQGQNMHFYDFNNGTAHQDLNHRKKGLKNTSVLIHPKITSALFNSFVRSSTPWPSMSAVVLIPAFPQTILQTNPCQEAQHMALGRAYCLEWRGRMGRHYCHHCKIGSVSGEADGRQCELIPTTICVPFPTNPKSHIRHRLHKCFLAWSLLKLQYVRFL